MNYMRFVTHIRYFARRLFSNDIAQTQDEMLFEQIKDRYPESYKCTVKVKRYIEELYHISISREEMVYSCFTSIVYVIEQLVNRLD